MQEIRHKLLEEPVKETNNLSKVELRFLNLKLKQSDVSREFRLQCLRDLQDAEMPINDFLATAIHGGFKNTGDSEEREAAKKLVREWSQAYLKSGNKQEFLEKLGYEE